MKKLKVVLLVVVLGPGWLWLSLSPQTAAALTVTDNFNRANGGLGGNWATVAGASAPQIAANLVVPGSAGAANAAYWSANAFGNNQYAQANFASVPGASTGPGVAVRLSAAHGYFLWYGDAPNEVSIWRLDSASTWTKLKQSGVLAMNSSDAWRLEAVGTTLSGYQNGNLVVQVTDATYGSGSPGIWLYNAANQLDNWSGGDLAGTYTVGGEVSGLSGTVVLTNNGGDDLSVSSGGPYAFATPVASGGNYSVAVKTNPAGQTCIVGSGSGTVAANNITSAEVTCETTAGTIASDNFNRANGALGAGWTDMSDGGMAISSGTVVGTAANLNSGDIRSGETYNNDQFSQIEVSSTQLTGGQWMGVTVRSQNSGQNLYLGIYWWNSGNPKLEMFVRNGNSYTQIGNAYSCGPLAAGTKLKLMVVGNTLAFLQDGVERSAGTDSSLTGGAPGVMDFDTPVSDNWSGGNAGFEVHYLSTDVNGVESYDVISRDDGNGPQVLRVLRPTSPAGGMPRNFLVALPVEAGLGNSFGDGVDTLRTANAQNQYNLTVIEPSFAADSWYADNPGSQYAQYEAFMTSELMPWIAQTLSTTGYEQTWLIGFSKSGIGGMDLLMKHPGVFTLDAAWDWPADDAAYDQFGASSSNNYGTDANFQANYRLTQPFVDAHKPPLAGADRIWIGGYNAFQNDVTDFDALLTAEGIPHLNETPAFIAHRWDSGWVPDALAALHQNSVNLPDTTAPVVTAFAVPAAVSAAAVPVTTFSAVDNIGVTGYKVTESAIAPGPGDSGWSAGPPAAYAASSSGAKTLYAWAKDAAGNVSVAMSASVTVTLPSPTGGSSGSPGGGTSGTSGGAAHAKTGGSAPAAPGPSASPAGTPSDSPTAAPSCTADCAQAAGEHPPADNSTASTNVLGLSRTIWFSGLGILLLGGIAGVAVAIRRARRTNNLT